MFFPHLTKDVEKKKDVFYTGILSLPRFFFHASLRANLINSILGTNFYLSGTNFNGFSINQ